MESLQNGLQPHSGVTLFVSIDYNKSYVASITTALTLNWYWSFVQMGHNRSNFGVGMGEQGLTLIFILLLVPWLIWPKSKQKKEEN